MLILFVSMVMSHLLGQRNRMAMTSCLDFMFGLYVWTLCLDFMLGLYVWTLRLDFTLGRFRQGVWLGSIVLFSYICDILFVFIQGMNEQGSRHSSVGGACWESNH